MELRSGWRRVGTHVTIWLTMAVALLSLLTGIANIGSQSVFGPLAAFIPPSVQRTAGFTGALTGFLMIASALGLRRGLRLAWYSTVVLLPITALQGLVQSSPLSLPLIVLSVLAMPIVLANRGRFDRSVQLSTTQLAAAAAIIGAQVYGTVGAYALRDEFNGIQTLVDAFYYTLVTASTVGYGDAAPTSQMARLFGMSVVVVGTASFAIALGTLLGPAIEARFARALGRMTESQLEVLENHVLVLGYGELTEAILDELRKQGTTDFVVITPNQSKAAELAERNINVLTASPSDEEPLRRGRIADARAVVAATSNDAEDALAVLTARQLRPDVHIASAVTDRDNIEKLRRAGATTVISPALLGGHLLVDAALGHEDVDDVASNVIEESERADGVELDDPP